MENKAKITATINELKSMVSGKSGDMATFCRLDSQLVDLIYASAMACGLSKETANKIVDDVHKDIMDENSLFLA